jgi:hypothetical protein
MYMSFKLYVNISKKYMLIIIIITVVVIVLLNFLSEITSKFRDAGSGNFYNISNVYTEFIVRIFVIYLRTDFIYLAQILR